MIAEKKYQFWHEEEFSEARNSQDNGYSIAELAEQIGDLRYGEETIVNGVIYREESLAEFSDEITKRIFYWSKNCLKTWDDSSLLKIIKDTQDIIENDLESLARNYMKEYGTDKPHPNYYKLKQVASHFIDNVLAEISRRSKLSKLEK